MYENVIIFEKYLIQYSLNLLLSGIFYTGSTKSRTSLTFQCTHLFHELIVYFIGMYCVMDERI